MVLLIKLSVHVIASLDFIVLIAVAFYVLVSSRAITQIFINFFRIFVDALFKKIDESFKKIHIP